LIEVDSKTTFAAVQKIEIFETREKGSKTASFERRRNGSILQNGAYDSGG
jgi:hypothetical protein